MSIPSLTVRPSDALQAYAKAQNADSNTSETDNFSSVLSRAMQDVVDTGRTADTQSVAAISGHGNLTDVVTAVSNAELTLQTTVAIRDRVVQAYQDIMKMSI